MSWWLMMKTTPRFGVLRPTSFPVKVLPDEDAVDLQGHHRRGQPERTQTEMGILYTNVTLQSSVPSKYGIQTWSSLCLQMSLISDTRLSVSKVLVNLFIVYYLFKYYVDIYNFEVVFADRRHFSNWPMRYRIASRIKFSIALKRNTIIWQMNIVISVFQTQR